MVILTDIHGCYWTMISLLAQIPQEQKDKGIVVAGDLIDRGPNSKQVIQYCIDNSIQAVKGNHEQMMLDFFDKGTDECKDIWLYNGGIQFLNSYNELNLDTGMSDRNENKLSDHIQWVRNLPLYLEFPNVKNNYGHLLVTHSSAAPVWKWGQKRRETNKTQFEGILMWNRDARIQPIPNVYNVFGHSPRKDNPRITSCYANIDTGACFKGQGNYGVMTALIFPEMKVYQQENVDV